MSLSTAKTTINWSSIIDENRRNLLWACQKILSCPKRAEDVLHDAFVRLSQLAPKQTSDIKKPEGYIFQVVRNISIDHKRRLNKEDGYLSELTPQLEVADTAKGPEQVALEHNLLNSIESSLAKLPQRTRDIFEIYRHGDYTQKEISEKYGISPTLVNFLIKDAIMACRNDLQSMN